MFSADDHRFMARALQLAVQGAWLTTPNPSVGCVLVRDGHILGEGHTLPAGQDHAEIQAIKDCLQRGDTPKGATAYVTLEPCSHHGRTPPCADKLAEAGIARVVAALTDPNPQVSGRGLQRLKAAGIRAEVGLLGEAARVHHIGFISRMERGQPWTRVKLAASLDGKTALNNGISQWITGPAARVDVHRLRARSCAMLTGIGTVLADNPQLNVREVLCSRQPARVVVDSQLRLPVDARLLEGGGVMVAHAIADSPRAAALQAMGVTLLHLPTTSGQVDLSALMTALGSAGMNEVTVEAGSQLCGALLNAGLVDELVLYLAPVLLGQHARGLFELPELTAMAGRHDLKWVDQRMVGQDLRLTAHLHPA
ncbi:bifunctional diaminohydroxyphosphoribosylaminopyrimidine deaminase/5-amino-6-(5-phosphoribosylamino)uracil reductase RibD [Chitinivorax sp. B]|uniref:bifunctional diaminohydroxyphosphoribosylaminopyrimidine deaminase/5-amino-6-(5-phosphoribosylamino)uracil reductase RibD n=1 Tax=Chitinivorax sp. B TaxID=2502235 RepID=UPI0010F98FEE|nr:bifunctional diaminohydroxyphosphoribosylaminopyrimidine deaminase/5-amino-6-(5-phosphoribosylamino)uracil reductase RibD [Chitinivorax sp. B]